MQDVQRNIKDDSNMHQVSKSTLKTQSGEGEQATLRNTLANEARASAAPRPAI